MSRPSTKPPSGMRDFLPDAIRKRRHVVGIIQDVYESYGFVPIETPSLENLSTLLGKYGEEGDQLLYRVLRRRDALKAALEKEEVTQSDLADLGLRYDLTVPLARVAAQYGELPKYFKRYQIQPVWRADRPGKGRFREFYQCDVDVTGTQSGIADAEVCSAAADVLQRLGFKEFEIRLNHRQLLRAMIEEAGIDASLGDSTLVALDKWDKIGEEGVRKEWIKREIPESAQDKLVGWLKDQDQGDSTERLESLRTSLQSEIAHQAIDEITHLIALCASMPAGPHLIFDPILARGLGYYTGCIFEVAVQDLAGSVGGGGRYDNLIGMFGRQPIPAVGFSLGLERILMVMEDRSLYPELAQGPDLMVCWRDVDEKAVLDVSTRLRRQGLRVETYPESAKFGKQIQYAASPGVGAHAVGVIGPDELEADEISLKVLESGEQSRVPVDQATKVLKATLSDTNPSAPR